MLTFETVKKYLNKLKYINSKLVRISNARMGFNKDDFPFFVAKTTSPRIYDPKSKKVITNPNQRVYVTMIEVLDEDRHVKLSCSCPDFLYRHEVALFTHDGADIEYSNGDYPKETNPLLHPSCCKHCLAFYELLHKKKILP